jgi:hypothetical protein
VVLVGIKVGEVAVGKGNISPPGVAVGKGGKSVCAARGTGLVLEKSRIYPRIPSNNARITRRFLPVK